MLAPTKDESVSVASKKLAPTRLALLKLPPRTCDCWKLTLRHQIMGRYNRNNLVEVTTKKMKSELVNTSFILWLS